MNDATGLLKTKGADAKDDQDHLINKHQKYSDGYIKEKDLPHSLVLLEGKQVDRVFKQKLTKYFVNFLWKLFVFIIGSAGGIYAILQIIDWFRS